MRNKKEMFISRSTIQSVTAVVGLAFAVLASMACGNGTSRTVEALPRAGAAGSQVIIDLHSDRADLSTPSAMCKSVLVADLTVGSVATPHWNTPGASRPASLTAADISSRGVRIYTAFSTRRIAILVDHRSVSTGEYVAFGGTIGADRVNDDQFPQLLAGQRYLVVFTASIDASGPTHTERVLLAFDAFPIDSQGQVLIQPTRVEQGKVSQAQVKQSLSDITSQLSRC